MKRRIKVNGHIILRSPAFLYLAQLQSFQCNACQRTELEIYEAGDLFERHHKVPLNQGGTNHIRNLQLLCSACHKALHNQTENYWIEPEPYKPFPYIHLQNQLGMDIL